MKCFKTGDFIRTMTAVAASVLVSYAAQARPNESDARTSAKVSINAQRQADQELALTKQGKSSGQGVRSIPTTTPEAPIPPPSSHKKKSQKKKKTA